MAFADAPFAVVFAALVFAACGRSGRSHIRSADLDGALDTADGLERSLVEGLRASGEWSFAQPARARVPEFHLLGVRPDFQRHDAERTRTAAPETSSVRVVHQDPYPCAARVGDRSGHRCEPRERNVVCGPMTSPSSPKASRVEAIRVALVPRAAAKTRWSSWA